MFREIRLHVNEVVLREVIDPETGSSLKARGEIVNLPDKEPSHIRYRSGIHRLYHDGCRCGQDLRQMESMGKG